MLSLPAESGPVPFLTPDGTGWRFTLSEQAAVYGLGEMPRGINKRGWHYITNNTDESRHSEDKLSFYGAHNFLLVRDGSTCFGLFVDFPGKVYYDIGYTRHDLFSFHTETPDYDLYLLSGGNENAICKEFRTLIGRSYIPPKWAFGLAQSRWGYKTEEDVREWFGHKYKALTDCGIEGFWNDMNEPALFYSPERLHAFLNDMAALREKDNIEQEEFFLRVVGGAMGLMNSPADYASFYHEVGGQKVRHDQVHNLYGGIWLGDNNSSWAQLLANIQMMPSVQMCGFLYSGADLCGFSYDTTRILPCGASCPTANLRSTGCTGMTA